MFPSAQLLYKENLEVSLYKIVVWGLLAAFLFLVVPFLLYETVRIGYAPSIDYNEGWNVVHTSRLLKGEPLYLPLNDFPLTPVAYPPLSFVIIGGLSYFTGSILLTGRVVALLSLLFVSYLIFKSVENFTSQKSGALLGTLLWLALMVQMSGRYIGMDDPQLLAHNFSVGAFCLYSRWIDKLSTQKICLIAFLCCFALFIKHLLIAVPLSLAVTLFVGNRRAFWTFALAGIVISFLMLCGSWLFGGEHLFSNFFDLHRPVSNNRLKIYMTRLFFDRFGYVFFLPCVALLFWSSKKWMSVLTYFFVSFALGSYVCRGVGVGLNAWFDFFIATAMIFGLFAAQKAHMRDMFVSSAIIDRILRPHWLIPFAVGLILVGTLANEFIDRILISHEYLQYLIKSNIRMLQAVFVLSGIALLLAGRQIAVNVNWLFFYGILASSLIPFSINLKTDLEILDHDKLKTMDEIYHQDVQLLRAIPGSALFEDALLGFDAGKQYLLDPFALAQMIVDGNIPEQILTNRIREKYFGVIVLDLSTQKRLPKLRKVQVDSLKPKTTISEHWTDNTLQAVTANYQLLDLKRPSLYFFYVPRINAS